MSELLLLGTSHKTAPLDLRERVALLEGRADEFLRELAADPAIR
jgi:glutamyl-tRNA reductase